MSGANDQVVSFNYDGQQYHFSSGLGDDFVLRQIRHEQSFYEVDLLEWVGHLSIGPGLFVDVGVFIGNHSIYFSRAMSRRVVAFESNPAAVRGSRLTTAA